jgi:UDP-2,4-diacetamido-2,4,6-trideoxy-beta-L-altropyranose hydrolase
MRDSPSAVIVADCGPAIGLGHLRRSLVVAEALRRRGVDCRVLTPHGEGAGIVAADGFPAASWPDDLRNLPPADILIADSYRFTLDEQRSWHRLFRLRVLIDDLGDREIDADMVVNGNLYADMVDYDGVFDGPILRGAAYATVAPSYFDVRDNLKPSPPHVLISFGGTDDGRLGSAVAAALLSVGKGIEVDLAITPLHTDPMIPDELHEDERFHLHQGADMPALMSRARLYVGAAGSTVVEATAASVPCVAVQLAENQRLMIEALRRAGVPVFDALAPDELAAAAVALLDSGTGNPLSDMLSPGSADRIAAAILDELAARR